MICVILDGIDGKRQLQVGQPFRIVDFGLIIIDYSFGYFQMIVLHSFQYAFD
jgi:hypothetical protein